MPETSGVKPLVTTQMVLPVLEAHFGRPIVDLESVPGGHVAQTFSFAVGSTNSGDEREPGSGGATQEYIIRFNATMLVNFEKEAYVYEHFASPVIPIPRVVHLGRLGDVHFAITEKAPGQNLLQIPRAEYLALIPRQIEMLDAIHQIPVGEKPGFGIFDGTGVAFWPSWRSHLEFVKEEEPTGDFYEGWHALFESSFLERDLFEQLYARMVQLISYCPEERYVVHGGYGFGNVLVQSGRITAVLDWMDARYGDFLFDVAWLDFWSPEDEWHERFQRHYESLRREVASYRERILCYQCYIALEAFKFNAKAADKASYDYTRQRILSLLRGRPS